MKKLKILILLNLNKESKDEDMDLLDQYLKNLSSIKEYKESPTIPDSNKIEVNQHRKSGKSSSPNRESIAKFKPLTSKYKDSTNIPLTSSLSSDGNSGGRDEINYQEENVILEELNELYQVFLSWIFSSRSELDLSRLIKYDSILPLWLNLAAKSTKLMKQKVISDFNFMMHVEKNATVIMSERNFIRWILDLLYTVFPPKKDANIDPIWDMGWKLYIQMNKMCFNVDHNAHSYLHQLIAWPISKFLKSRSNNYKLKNDIRKRERMVRTILFSFLDTISANKEREKYNPSWNTDTPYMKFWRNIIQVTFYVEELVLSFSATCQAFSEEQPTKRPKKHDTSFMREFTMSLLEDTIEKSVFEHAKKGLFYSNSTNIWQDSRLLDTIFDIIEPIWLIKAKRRSTKVRKGVQTTGYGR